MLQAPSTLTIGDRVIWRGGWGADPPAYATVTTIERVRRGEKYGTPVREIPWAAVRDDEAVVNLDNGHWAYGSQLSPVQEHTC